ncbi:ABC transporter permease [Nesterenkonia populi]
MTISDLFRGALRNAFRHPMRAFLTIVAVIIGAFTFTITSGLSTGVNDYIDSQTRAVGATNTVQVTATSPTSFLNETMEEYDEEMTSAASDSSSGILSEEDIETIESLLDSEDELSADQQVSPLYYSHDDGQKYRFIYNGYWPGKTMNLVAGEQLSDDTDETQVIIPSYAYEDLGFDAPEDAIGSTVEVGVLGQGGQVHEIEPTVVGIQERSLIGGNLPFGNKNFHQELQDVSWAGAEPGAARWYTSAMVTTDDTSRITEVLQDEGYSVSTAEDIVGDFRSIVSAVLLLLNMIAAVAIAAGLFGIVNTLLMSVQERTRQIGMLRALGLSRGWVFASTALEAALLSIVGSIVAAGLAIGVGTALGPVALDMAGLDLPGLNLFEFQAAHVVLIIAGVTLASLLASLLPALRAARLNPMDALRTDV